METIECTEIQCPSQESFSGHLKIMDEIIKTCGDHGTKMETINTNESRLTITWKVSFKDPLKNIESIVAAMGVLSSHNIVPGKVIDQWPIDNPKKCAREVFESVGA